MTTPFVSSAPSPGAPATTTTADTLNLRWTLPDGVEVAYSLARDGDQREPTQRNQWLQQVGVPWPVVVPRQIHGVTVVPHDADTTALAVADGVISTDTMVALGAYGADCPGIVISTGDALGVAHCGWRGTAGGMVGQLVAALAARSRHPPARWYALIGPGISGPCYEVDQPVLSARTWPTAAITPSGPTHAHLHLAQALAVDLATAGITHVQCTDVCTFRTPSVWSYRRNGPGQVQLLVAWRPASSPSLPR